MLKAAIDLTEAFFCSLTLLFVLRDVGMDITSVYPPKLIVTGNSSGNIKLSFLTAINWGAKAKNNSLKRETKIFSSASE